MVNELYTITTEFTYDVTKSPIYSIVLYQKLMETKFLLMSLMMIGDAQEAIADHNEDSAKMLLIKQIKYNDEVKIGVIYIKEVDTIMEAHHIAQSFIANFSSHRKDLQDVLQCSMSRRMPKISPLLLLLLNMIKITRIQLYVL